MLKQVSLEPTRELGYFCGLVIGDGWLAKQKSRNYRLCFRTPDLELVDIIRNLAITFKLTLHQYEYSHRRSFPNGTTYEGSYQELIMDSKILHDALRPFKMKDHQWRIPTFLTTLESKIGFVEGFFDAEGAVLFMNDRVNCSLVFVSKCESGLEQIQRFLLSMGIHSILRKNQRINTLSIHDKRSVDLFRNVFKFRLPRKRKKLAQWRFNKRICMRFNEFEDMILIRQHLKGVGTTKMSASLLRSPKSIRYRLARLGVDGYQWHFKGLWDLATAD